MAPVYRSIKREAETVSQWPIRVVYPGAKWVDR